MVIFVCVDPPVQYRNEKMPTSQPDLLFFENLHLREPLVGSLAFFHFGTEHGMPLGKINIYITNINKI